MPVSKQDQPKQRAVIIAGTRTPFVKAFAEYLALAGVPFRQAHGIVGRIVRACVAQVDLPTGIDLVVTAKAGADSAPIGATTRPRLRSAFSVGSITGSRRNDMPVRPSIVLPLAL